MTRFALFAAFVLLAVATACEPGPAPAAYYGAPGAGAPQQAPAQPRATATPDLAQMSQDAASTLTSAAILRDAAAQRAAMATGQAIGTAQQRAMLEASTRDAMVRASTATAQVLGIVQTTVALTATMRAGEIAAYQTSEAGRIALAQTAGAATTQAEAAGTARARAAAQQAEDDGTRWKRENAVSTFLSLAALGGGVTCIVLPVMAGLWFSLLIRERRQQTRRITDLRELSDGTLVLFYSDGTHKVDPATAYQEQDAQPAPVASPQPLRMMTAAGYGQQPHEVPAPGPGATIEQRGRTIRLLDDLLPVYGADCMELWGHRKINEKLGREEWQGPAWQEVRYLLDYYIDHAKGSDPFTLLKPLKAIRDEVASGAPLCTSPLPMQKPGKSGKRASGVNSLTPPNGINTP